MTEDSESGRASREGSVAETGDVLTEVQYDPAGGRELAGVIVETVAARTGADTSTYRETPLQDYVDVDEVETLLFGTQDPSTGEASRKITFRYRRFLVTVRADGVIQLSDSAE
ncbi:HalOD1 output domain-containing protein [Haloarcula brevis]|uniref:HalOD1 output domain-containing protein n=1 Tax=Haloarcula brevis TaxID=3111453 RepID=UPI00300EF42F